MSEKNTHNSIDWTKKLLFLTRKKATWIIRHAVIFECNSFCLFYDDVFPGLCRSWLVGIEISINIEYKRTTHITHSQTKKNSGVWQILITREKNDFFCLLKIVWVSWMHSNVDTFESNRYYEAARPYYMHKIRDTQWPIYLRISILPISRNLCVIRLVEIKSNIIVHMCVCLSLPQINPRQSKIKPYFSLVIGKILIFESTNIIHKEKQQQRTIRKQNVNLKKWKEKKTERNEKKQKKKQKMMKMNQRRTDHICVRHHDKIEHWIDEKLFMNLNGILSPLFVIYFYCFIFFLVSSLLIRQHDSPIYQLDWVDEEDSLCGKDKHKHI